MSRIEPKNRMEAFCYQFEDDVKLLKALALVGRDAAFWQSLNTLKAHIKAYESNKISSKETNYKYRKP